VLHLLDPAESFPECRRVLRSSGFLVAHETVAWFDRLRGRLPALGFQQVDEHLLPKDAWWTDYGAPLEARIEALRRAHGGAQSPDLDRYDAEVKWLKTNPADSECGFFIVQSRADE
jgi:hypothetical protein